MIWLLLSLLVPAIVAGTGEEQMVGCPGCPFEVKTLDAHDQEIVNFAFAQLEAESGNANARKVFHVTNFKKQVVAGMKYTMTLELVDTDCPKTEEEDSQNVLTDCTTATAPTESCTLSVWDKPWEGFRQLLPDSVECNRKEDPESDEEEPESDQEEPDSKRESKLHHVTLTKGESNVNIAVGNAPPKHLLGGDSHDFQHHGKPLFGEDGHDAEHHGKPLLGGDGHDLQHHGKPLIGGDGHDQKPHHKHLLGSGDHDYKSHGMKKLKTHVQSAYELSKLQSLQNFHAFMKTHKKEYSSMEEYKKRYGIFKENMKKVQFLRESEQGTAKYGATHLADLTEEEFKKNFLGVDKTRDDPDVHWPPAEIPNIDLPPEFDWRKYNAVTPVKNQGACGSCWAFSVTGNVEGQWAVKHKELLNLSEQELVDCDKRDAGCNGGLPENAYKTLLELGGLELEEEYEYEGKDETCQFNKSEVAATVTGGLEISQNETQMAQWLVKNGPISVGLNANAMQFYFGGISHPWRFLCSAESIDHGVLIVGFGEHEYPLFHRKLPFWIIKNSWGPGWGEKGYYRLYRGDGTCGINMMTSSAIVG